MNTHPKTFWQKVWKEIKSIAGVALYFTLWLGILMLLKRLTLEDYKLSLAGIRCNHRRTDYGQGGDTYGVHSAWALGS